LPKNSGKDDSFGCSTLEFVDEDESVNLSASLITTVLDDDKETVSFALMLSASTTGTVVDGELPDKRDFRKL
jgi:hypothetical protein